MIMKLPSPFFDKINPKYTANNGKFFYRTYYNHNIYVYKPYNMFSEIYYHECKCILSTLSLSISTF